MRNETKVREWQVKFNLSGFDNPDRRTQIDAGWYDWFCRDTSLANKTKKMGRIIKQVKDGGKINLDTMYVWFKNNCPLNGPLYDDFRFADRETGDVQFTIQIDCCWNNSRYAVYARKTGWDKPAFETNSSKELVKWLNASWEE